MSEAGPERKRRRKTRAERNQTSHHRTLEVHKQKKHLRTIKDMEDSQNTSYMLRSGRSASHPAMAARNDRRAAVATITQGRLTRQLGILSFSNARASDWIKRGPINETETMKKKVESDLKSILSLAERSTLTCTEEFNTGSLIDLNKKTEDTRKTTNTKLQVYLDPTASRISPQAVGNRAAEILHSAEVGRDASVTVTATVAHSQLQVQNAVSRCADSFTSASTSPNSDEMLELEPPVEEIAEKILKELKPKFDKMFPNRDLELEICSDLQKLFKQSVGQTQTPHTESVQGFFLLQDNADPVNLCTPVLEVPVTASSTLSVCRPPRKTHTRHLCPHHRFEGELRADPHASVSLGDSVFYPCGSAHGSTAFNAGASSSFTTTFLMPDLPGTEEIMRINVNVDESDDEDDDVLSMARYNAFLACARELEVEQDQLLNRLNPFGGVTPSVTNHHQQFIDQQRLLQRSCGLTDEDMTSCSSRDPQSNSQSSDWRNTYSAARILDFSEPSGGHQHRTVLFSCPARSEDSCTNTHFCHTTHPGLGTQQDCLSHMTPDKPHFLIGSQKFSVNSVNPCGLDKWWTCQHPFMSPHRGLVQKEHTSKVGPSLAQSRINFQSALNTACKMSDVSHMKITEPMDWHGCDSYPSSIQSKNFPHKICGVSSGHFMSRSLSELQTHQADLQRQARDFLDDLDRCAAKPERDFIGCHAGPLSRHFQMLSPDSNASPVWIPPVLKDIELETGSFV